MTAAREDPARFIALEGRLALVAGGAGGIGSAIVRMFQAAGAAVVVADRPGTTAPEDAEFLPCDVADAASVASLFETLQKTRSNLDILVHAAGVTQDAVLWKMTPDAWQNVLRVNLDSAFHLLHGAVPMLRRAESASVILVTSINGERGKFGQANYAASKAGLIGLGRTAARELGAFGIRVNMIAPGMIRTAMTEALTDEVRERAQDESVLRRLGEPDDVARVALFLASGLSRHVTGQVLRVDGGQLIA
ncbi:MAG: SDR family oxidoreductase [Candidatus Krumholzibacteria bacterium]|nr:SDR family oxidoreductase [Candidatus Krumholzibacteria bacterium]MDH4335814.1 SDR family oxidoreductase [Candidatus Krumholzibacteria bacterium]MDH5269340.1 SDR family oxidoreductase [Candidatus Krumholzibacteria bacterium]